MKKLISLLVLVALISGCAYHRALTASEKGNLSNSKGKKYYTLANIWFPELNRTSSSNIHLNGSVILPVGTKVIMGRCDNKCIYFSDESGASYRMRLNLKNTIDMMTFFNRYFSEVNPMAEGGGFYQFSKLEQENIKNHTIDYGMSREAVSMSYGYPPPEKGFTPDIKSDKWIYIENSKLRTIVYFKDNKVVNIEDAKALFKKPFRGREQRFTERESGVQANASKQNVSGADEISKYKQLLDSGAITKEEYEQKKKQLLGL